VDTSIAVSVAISTDDEAGAHARVRGPACAWTPALWIVKLWDSPR